MPSLSVCVFSNQPTARLAAVLAPFRTVADEVVVVIDDRVVEPQLAVLDGIADSVSVLPFLWPLERNLEHLHSLCSGDWILRLDGDEVPSTALLDVLAGDAWHQGVTHCGITRRWVSGDGVSWIVRNPWYPDVQWRLMRNDPGLVSYSTLVHEPTWVQGPGRVLAAPIYHLDLVDNDLSTRRHKTRRYFRTRPELRTHGGLSMGSYYAPELAVTPYRLELIPPEDLVLIHAARAGTVIRPATGTDPEPVQAPIDLSPGRSMSVEVTHVDDLVYQETNLEVLITITNTGTDPIGPSGKAPIRVGAQWTDPTGTMVHKEARADLVGDIAPAGQETVPMLVSVPPAGVNQLRAGALVEGVEWVSRAPSVEITSIEQPTITIVGGYSIHRHLGDDLIVRTLIERLTDACPDARLRLLANDAAPLQERFGVPAVQDATVVHAGNVNAGMRGDASISEIVATHRRRAEGIVGDTHIYDFADTIGESDVFVIAAAGSLAGRYRNATLLPRLIEAEIAHEARVPIVIASSGFGPFSNLADRRTARRLFTIASRIFVRDPLSRRGVMELGVPARRVEMLPDAATGIEPGPVDEVEHLLASHGISAGRPYLVASVRADDPPDLLALVAESIVTAAETLDLPVVLMPHCASVYLDDRPPLNQIRGMLADTVRVVELGDIPPDVVAADLVRNAVVSVGTRFHNGVLSASWGKPSVLICDSEYDLQRARGLGRLPGTRILTVSRETRDPSKRVREIVRQKGTPVQTPDPDPATSTILALALDHWRARPRVAEALTDR